MASNLAFSPFVQAELEKWYIGTYKESKLKEKPMTATQTISPSELGAAKKKRDVLRQQMKNHIAKFCEAYGCTEFEAAHAIFDPVLQGIDNSTKMYSTPALPSALGQTFLEYTLALTHGTPTFNAEANAPAKKVAPATKMLDTQVQVSNCVSGPAETTTDYKINKETFDSYTE